MRSVDLHRGQPYAVADRHWDHRGRVRAGAPARAARRTLSGALAARPAAETAAAPSVVLSQAAETLARSLKLPYVAIVHDEDDGPRLLAVAGTAPAVLAQVPLTYAR